MSPVEARQTGLSYLGNSLSVESWGCKRTDIETQLVKETNEMDEIVIYGVIIKDQ